MRLIMTAHFQIIGIRSPPNPHQHKHAHTDIILGAYQTPTVLLSKFHPFHDIFPNRVARHSTTLPRTPDHQAR
jgi:hypothetical protein